MPGLSAELSLITLHWFLTAFASVVPVRLLLRLWDLLFYDGSRVLFQTTLGMLRLKVLSPPDSEPREPHTASRHPPPGDPVAPPEAPGWDRGSLCSAQHPRKSHVPGDGDGGQLVGLMPASDSSSFPAHVRSRRKS